MRGGYKRFRRRINRGAFFKSFMLGVSLALTSAAVVLLLGKLNVIEDNPMLALIIGGGVGLFAFVLWCVILTPTKARAARLIDEELRLSEKAQTMLAFMNERGRMVQLQRAETEKLLRKLPSGWYPIKRIWVYALILLLSLALCSFAYAAPDRPTPPPELPPEEPFELTVWQETALVNLIEYVEASTLRDTAKAAVTDELEALLAELRETKLDRQMRALVVGAITDINSAIDLVNSYDEIVAELKKSDVTAVAELADAIGTPTNPMPSGALDALCGRLSEGGLSAVNTNLVIVGTDIAVSLGRLSLPSDPLISAISGFSDGLFDISDEISDYGEDELVEAVDSLFASFKVALDTALSEQRINGDVGTYVVNRLMEIFGISASELPPEVKDEINRDESEGDEEEPPEDDEEQKGDSGGFGSGDMIYGSDDLIYYPDEEKYVAYGEVINEYYAKITEKILSGELPPEIIPDIEKYFESLYDGAAKEDDQGE